MNQSKKISNTSSKKGYSFLFFRAAFLTLTVFALAGILFWAHSFASSAGNKTNELNGDEFWQDVDESSIESRGVRQIVPQKYRTVRLNQTAIRNFLADAPVEFSEAAKTREAIFSLPLPDGTFSRFRIEESPIMHPDLAAKFPEIKTYRGQGIDDATAVLRFDLTPAGFHAQILRAGVSVYIDPYAAGDTENYVSYLKTDYISGKRMNCIVEGGTEKPESSNDEPNVVVTGGILRTYRLALAGTVEYTNTYGGTVTGAMGGMVTTMLRVNGIYERDVAIRMIIIPNNNLIIYTGDPAADPYTNDDGSAMLAQNQANLNTVIGAANYDIGHVFSTGGGGVARLRSPCGANKAQGVTGLPMPVGDPFNIDYVAHEMGHQWGGNHTFNGSAVNCAPPNRSIFAGVEPGSGVTIQAYAGICGPQDLQLNSIDQFHVYSLQEIVTFSSNQATGGSCDLPVAVTNTPPSVTAPAAFTIPKLTPFKLTALATDLEDLGLTYNWEEVVPGLAPSPPDTDVDGMRPLFRSYSSTTNASRTFPSMRFVLNNSNMPPQTYDCGRTVGGNPLLCTTGEALPAVAATRDYQVTVRDNHSGGGGVRSVLTQVTIDAASGPFKVTQPDSNVTFNTGSTPTITWLVANTNLPTVNAANVNIRLSTDGGLTFPVLLKSTTPNDGSEMVTIPNTATTTARILIEAAENVFFDVSDTNFTIALAPTSAPAGLSGRITDAYGRPLRGVRVRLFNAGGTLDVTATTNARGIYRFTEVPTGADYFLTPARRGYRFNPETRFFTHLEEESNLNFSARYD